MSGIDSQLLCKDLAFPTNEKVGNPNIFNNVEVLGYQDEKKKIFVKGRKAELIILPVKFKIPGQLEDPKPKVVAMKVPTKRN